MKRITMMAACLLLGAAAAGVAGDDSKKPALDRAQLQERHEKMTELHRKAAECLKSGKEIQACHDAMIKEHPGRGHDLCPFGEDECPMCGKGRRGGRGWRRGPKSDEKSKT